MPYKGIKINGKKYDYHRFVFEQSIGKKLKRDEIVHHINGDKSDNRLVNLQLMSLPEHASLHFKPHKQTQYTRDLIRKIMTGACHYKAKFTDSDILLIRKLYSLGFKIALIRNIYSVSSSIISRIVSRKRWSHIPEMDYSQEELDDAIEALRNGDKKPIENYVRKGGILPMEGKENDD